MRRGYIKASYTIEAAILAPILIFMIAKAMSLSVELYTQTKEMAANLEMVERFDSAKRVEEIKWIYNMKEQ